MNRRTLLATLVVVAVSGAPGTAHAVPPTIVRGQFTDRVERSRPVGDAAALATARNAYYWVEIRNPGEATTITMVFSRDGRVVHRQQLAVGAGMPRWRTWAMTRVAGARTLQVQILDATGAAIHTDTATIAAR